MTKVDYIIDSSNAVNNGIFSGSNLALEKYAKRSIFKNYMFEFFLNNTSLKTVRKKLKFVVPIFLSGHIKSL